MMTNASPSLPGTQDLTRRSLIARVGAGWAMFSAASLTGLLATARFMFPNDLFEPPMKFMIGMPADFAATPEGAVDERFKAKNAIWVIRTYTEFYILSTTCTHLGCTPNWLPTERKFKCPCHGSGFYATGVNFEGPAPRPLERFKIALAPDGQIEVDKNRKFQKELGQWEDPQASLKFVYAGA